MFDKKIVITGGLGYIGMELSLLLSGISRTNKITVLDKSFFSERVNQLKNWGIYFKQVDILNEEELSKEIIDADIIFHLAGITDVGTTKFDINFDRDEKIRRVGVEGTRNIIEYSNNFAKIIFPSTHVVYEGLTKQYKEISENRPPKPIFEYAKGKFISENDLISSGKNYVILRLGSVFGNSFDSTRVNIMPNLFSKITASNGTIRLFNGGSQLKSLVSVKDVSRCMRFVAENNFISKEIYNCVGENKSVKEVADLCKKYNKNLKIISTKDPVPNSGYTLSNKKILREGFKFLYRLDNSLNEMICNWTFNNKKFQNETIEVGKDNFVDERGIISNYYFEDKLNMIGYVESSKGSVRGNHYHPVQTQKCLLIKGQYISVTKDMLDPKSVIETKLINPGDLSTIPPYIAHTMIFTQDSIFLNLVNGEREHKNYGLTHTIKEELVNVNLASRLISTYKTFCRVCDSNRLYTYLSLGISPLANNLLNSKYEDYPSYPLELNLCQDCYNTQLSIAVPKEEMFSSYLYLSSTSESFQNHFENFAIKIKKSQNLNTNSLVVDIGSNDGIFLKPLKKLGLKAIGIEPAKNIAKIANKNGFFTYAEFFNKKTVRKIIKNYGKADLVTAFNVFAHNDDLIEIADSAVELLNDKGIFVIEVQYILNTINDLTFDNIYHEHLNYWSVSSLINLMKKTKLKIIKVEKIDTHGGSIRVYCSPDKKQRAHKSVKIFLNNEIKEGIYKFETYKKFAKDVNDVKIKSIINIENILKKNHKIIGYGSPAKATTILNYFGIDEEQIKYVIDDNQLKHEKFIPGTQIQIKSLKKVNPDEYNNVLVLAWNYYNQIVQSNKKIFKNAKFIKLK